MAWNWQHKDWPNFHWDSEALVGFEAQFMQNIGIQIGSVKHLDDEARQLVMIDILTGEALKTSEIEGEILNRDSVQSSILAQCGLIANQRRVPPAEHGISQLMIDLHRNFAKPLDDLTLYNWHAMVTNGRTDLLEIGSYRSQGDPMRIVSGVVYKPKVHFEAPPALAMRSEMTAFIEWFSQTSSDGAMPLPPLTRAGIAHLYFVSIHPFEDGNGRIARALSQQALEQSIRQPSLLALSQTIQRDPNAYYDALEQSNKGVEITSWLAYFCATVIAAQAQSQILIDFLIAKTKLYDRLRGELNQRQQHALARVFREGPDGFKGGMSVANYITITGAARATATRDLADLVRKGAFVQTGMLKSTRYWLSISK